MPYKYIGRTTDFKGKSLWEIVGNLKNFGIGRIVARNRMERYPESSYLKILKVETLPSPKEVSLDNVRKVRVLVEETWRGKTNIKPKFIESASYKWDYKLIPKDEEAKYCKKKEYSVETVLPRNMDFPPLFQELLRRDSITSGNTVHEIPKLEIAYNRRSMKSKYRIADEGEKPDLEISGLGQPASPNLYKRN